MSTKNKYPKGMQNRKRYNSLRNYDFDITATNKLAEITADLFADKDADQDIRMMNELLDHYDIDRLDPDRWFFLAHELASNYIPCFQSETAKRGRPKQTLEEKEKLTDLVLKCKESFPKLNWKQTCIKTVKQNDLSLSPNRLNDIRKEITKKRSSKS